MNGLREIHAANRAAADLPQTKREKDFRVQRDQLGQALRKVLALKPMGAVEVGTEADARKVLADVYGD